MQYLIIAYDYDDALERRLEVREEHLKGAKELMASGKIVQAGAFIEDDKMVGSTIMTNFESEDELNQWLENEPYVKNRVWDMEELQIVPIKLIS